MELGQKKMEEAETEPVRHREASLLWSGVIVAATVLTVVVTLDQLRLFFGFQLLAKAIPLDNHYLYTVLGLLLPLNFLIYPAFGKSSSTKVPLYDVGLFLLSLATCGFFIYNSTNIVDQGWEFVAPDHMIYASYVLWILMLEAVRRAGGTAIFAIVLLVSLYPVVADKMPGPISGSPSSLADTAAYHAMSIESILGIPLRAFAKLVIGFLIFGVALQHTGGGTFFLNLAFSLLGHVRGGAAKVAIFSSGLMGSMSGSVITNVLTTGVLTIPAMKRTGFRKAYAGGVEACASTGGVLMPPVMGTTAFIMATIIEVPYAEIALAAAIPSALYFFGLFMQIDAYSARHKLTGIPRVELPALGKTIREGWYFVFVFAFLIFAMVYLRREASAPFYATAMLLVINQVFPHHRWNGQKLLTFVMSTGKLLAELAAILGAVGLIVGAMSMSGMAGTLVNDLVYLAGGSIIVLLFMGALTSFIMGIGMTVTAAYIFLAIILAPALIQGGLNPMAVHLFILYWGMLSFITPPVALGAFAAATVAGTSPMKTGFEAMRLGSIIYFIPFFFVLNPAFILQGEWSQVIKVLVGAILGIWLSAGALQGYVQGIGDLTRSKLTEWPVRVGFAAAGIMLALPGGGLIPWTDTQLWLAATVTGMAAFALNWLGNMRRNIS